MMKMLNLGLLPSYVNKLPLLKSQKKINSRFPSCTSLSRETDTDDA